MPTPPDVSIIISCFDEALTIDRCVRTVAEALPEAEIVVVHGGGDRTLEIARGLRAEFPQVTPVRNENDRGKGHGIRTGIARAAGRCMAQFDADLQFRAADLPALVGPLVAGDADVCLGSRFLPGSDRAAYQRSFFRDWGNRLLAAYVSALVGRRVTDVTAGMKAWTRTAIERIDFRDDRYSYEAEIVVRAARLGLRIRELPVAYASRAAGRSMHAGNLAVIRAGLTIMVKCLAYRFRARPAPAAR